MAGGRKRLGPPEDSSSSGTKQRFSLPNYPDTRRRNMKKAIAGVLVVLVMFLTPGAAVAGLHESTWPGCFPLRSSGMFAHAYCVTTRVTAGVGGGSLALWLGFQKPAKKRQTTPRSIIMQTFFHGNPGKKGKFRKFTSSMRTALNRTSLRQSKNRHASRLPQSFLRRSSNTSCTPAGRIALCGRCCNRYQVVFFHQLFWLTSQRV